MKTGLTKKQKILLSIKNGYSNWLFLLPFIVGLGLLIIYPCIMALMYSFTDFNGIFMTKWGTFNFSSMFDFSKYGLGKEIWGSFGLTAVYALISIPINIVLSFALALLLQKEVPGIRWIRLLFYLPVLIPSIVFGQIWKDMLNYPTGLINQWFGQLGWGPYTFLSAAKTQLGSLIAISQWTLGGSMIVWLAALGNVPPTLYEAAEIDGASYFRKLFQITIPMCTSLIFYNLISLVIMCLQTFDSYAYLGRGIENATYFVSIRIYYTAFEEHNYGLACAIAWMLFIIIALLTVVMFKSSKWVYYEDEQK